LGESQGRLCLCGIVIKMIFIYANELGNTWFLHAINMMGIYIHTYICICVYIYIHGHLVGVRALMSRCHCNKKDIYTLLSEATQPIASHFNTTTHCLLISEPQKAYSTSEAQSGLYCSELQRVAEGCSV